MLDGRKAFAACPRMSVSVVPVRGVKVTHILLAHIRLVDETYPPGSELTECPPMKTTLYRVALHMFGCFWECFIFVSEHISMSVLSFFCCSEPRSCCDIMQCQGS